MNTKFEWIVHELQVTPSLGGLQNVVGKIAWEAQARNGIAFVREQGISNMAEPKQNSFVEYSQISKETALKWLWESIDKNAVEQEAEEKIKAILQPPLMAKPLPWES